MCLENSVIFSNNEMNLNIEQRRPLYIRKSILKTQT